MTEMINEHDLRSVIANELGHGPDGSDWAAREGIEVEAVLSFGQQQTNAVHVAVVNKLGMDSADTVTFAIDMDGDRAYLHATQELTDNILRGGFANAFRAGWECHKAFRGERDA